MKQRYFILVLAHSVHGRIQRIHLPHTVIYAILALAVLGSFSVFGFVGSYGRMVWKVAASTTSAGTQTAPSRSAMSPGGRSSGITFSSAATFAR